MDEAPMKVAGAVYMRERELGTHPPTKGCDYLVWIMNNSSGFYQFDESACGWKGKEILIGGAPRPDYYGAWYFSNYWLAWGFFNRLKEVQRQQQEANR